MTLDFHALWTLTGMGTVVFSTLAAPSGRGRAALAAGFAAASAAGAWFGPPSADAAGLLVGGAAVLLLLRPWAAVLAPWLGGALAGIWGIMLAAQDLPLWLALPIAAVVPAAAALRASRPGFAPPRLREEALVVVAAFAVATAVVPGVQAGWQAAINLSLQSSQPGGAVPPVWTLAVGASALALGGLYSLWSRR